MIDPHTAYALSLLRQYDPDRADRIEGAYRVMMRLNPVLLRLVKGAA